MFPVNLGAAIPKQRKISPRPHHRFAFHVIGNEFFFGAAGLNQQFAGRRYNHALPRHAPFTLLTHVIAGREIHTVLECASGEYYQGSSTGVA